MLSVFSFSVSAENNENQTYIFYFNYDKDSENKSVWYTGNGTSPTAALKNGLDAGHIWTNNTTIKLSYNITFSGGDIVIHDLDGLSSSSSPGEMTWHVYQWNVSQKKWLPKTKALDEYTGNDTIFALKYANDTSFPKHSEKLDTRWFFLSWSKYGRWINATGWDGASALISACKKHNIPLYLNESVYNGSDSFRGWIVHI